MSGATTAIVTAPGVHVPAAKASAWAAAVSVSRWFRRRTAQHIAAQRQHSYRTDKSACPNRSLCGERNTCERHTHDTRHRRRAAPA